MIENINLKKIEKKNWKSFSFNEIANKISETVNPSEANVDIYVGLEHLDSNSIEVKRFGSPSEVSGGKLKCYPGDVIFGKRRAYQRKAAVVDFHGICSAHSFVFRSNNEFIRKEIFPFFLHSDQFMNRMIDISVGGLSPTINWNDLKKEKFILPPNDFQDEIISLLQSIHKIRKNTEELIKITERYFQKIIDEIFNEFNEYTNFGNIKKLYFKGITNYNNDQGNLKLIPSGSVFPRKLKKDKIKTISLINKKDQDKALFKGDILFNSGGVGTLGRSHFFELESNIFFPDSFVMVFRVNDTNFLKKFIYYVFQSQHISRETIKYTKGTTGIISISKDGIDSFKIPKVPIKVQKKLVEKLEKIENTFISLNNYLNSTKNLQNKIINSIF